LWTISNFSGTGIGVLAEVEERMQRAQEDAVVTASSNDGDAEDIREEFASLAVSPYLLTPRQSQSPYAGHSRVESGEKNCASSALMDSVGHWMHNCWKMADSHLYLTGFGVIYASS